jgi:hypothetical protein
LKQPLGNHPGLDATHIGSPFAADLRAIGFALMMKVLVSRAAGYRRPGPHPEVTAVNPHGLAGLLEGNLNFETHALEADDGQWIKGRGGGKENPTAAMGMDHGNQTHQGNRRDARADQGCDSAR